MTDIKSKSLIRKFSIVFVFVALVPLIILYYVYVYLDQTQKSINIFNISFSIILVIVGIIILCGFLITHITLKKASLLTKTVSKSVLHSINEADEKVMLELAKGDSEIADLAKSFLTIIKRTNANKGDHHKQAIEIINDSAVKISNILSAQNRFAKLMQVVLENLREALGARHAAIFSAQDGRYILKYWTSNDKAVTPEQLTSAAQLCLEHLNKQKVSLLPTESEKSDNPAAVFSPLAAFSPLIFNDNFLGMLCLSGNMYWKNLDNFPKEHLSVIVRLSQQIALAFESASVDDRAEQTLFETLVALAQAVEARDPYSRGHCGRVSRYAQKMGVLMGLPEADRKILKQSSLLHDIGKIGIKYNVLLRSGRITVDELDTIRNHPLISEILLSHLKSYAHLLDPIRHHHEQLDGSGYPDGLIKDDLSTVTQIISVANIYDILLMQRPYRPRMDYFKMEKEMGHLVKSRKVSKEMVRFLYSAIKHINQEQ